MVDGFMSYPTYYIIGRSDKWHDYRNALNQLVGAPLAGPALLLPIISLPVIWLRPSAVPKIAVIISVLLIWTSEILTVKLVWPIHGQLIKAYPHAVDRLIFMDHWVRKSIQTINIAVVFYILYKAVKK